MTHRTFLLISLVALSPLLGRESEKGAQLVTLVNDPDDDLVEEAVLEPEEPVEQPVRLKQKRIHVIEPPSTSSWNCQNRAHPIFIDVRDLEGNGIGFKESYASADLFFTGMTRTWLAPFFDFRGHYFYEERKYAANAGFGLRDISESLQTVFGVNFFFDYRQIKHSRFYQAGSGIEILGKEWDFRINGYIPVFGRRKTLSKRLVTRHDELFLEKKTLSNFVGADGEISRVLFKTHGVNMKLTVGSYYLNGLFEKKAIGGLLRLSGHLSPYIYIEGQGSYDPLFKWRGEGQLGLIIPFGRRLFDLKKRDCPKACYHPQERLLEQVSRFEIIPIRKHKERESFLD